MEVSKSKNRNLISWNSCDAGLQDRSLVDIISDALHCIYGVVVTRRRVCIRSLPHAME